MIAEPRPVLIRRYADGPERFARALEATPEAARQFRPADGGWTVHEVVLHCADSETNAHMRLRYLLSEPDPLILGYDQDHWARTQHYHARPIGLALATIRAVRANTVPLLELLSDADFRRTGRHTERGPYSVDDWLVTYAEHLETHARQVERVVKEWRG